MVVIGAKGFASEVMLDVYKFDNQLVFFDDINNYKENELIFNKYRILKTIEDAYKYFKEIDNKFILGVGNPKIRRILYNKMKDIGGEVFSTISEKSIIGEFNVHIGKGSNIRSGVNITNDIYIGNCCLINLNCTIGHNSIIHEFCELNPGVHISGNVIIGKGSMIGTGSVILPKIEIGENVIIGAGALVNKNIPPNSVAVGVPAKIIKMNL